MLRLVRQLSTSRAVWQANASLLARRERETLRCARSNPRLIPVLRFARQMKENGVKPDLAVYNTLLACVAHEGLPLEASAVIDDMTAMGILPDRQSYHHLLHACRWSSIDIMWQVVDAMKSRDIQPDEQTYAFIVRRATTTECLELALQYMREMETLGLVPKPATVRDVVKLAANMDLPKLAIEIAQNAPGQLGGETWVACLISSAGMLYADGVKLCWQQVVHTLKLTPDEGACLSVLQTCARHALSDLALDVMRVLRGIGIDPWQEHHFAPLVEALCKDGKLKGALHALNQMRQLCIKPTVETVRPVTEYVQQDVDRLDGVWKALDQWRQEGNTVHVLVLNAVVQAAVCLNDLRRAVGAYKSFPDYGCKPTVDTFNSLLSGCVAAKHRQLGDQLLLDLKQAGVTPNAKTYEHIVLLCLTQPVYDDAFFFLEEMKTQRFVPSAEVYTAIVECCVAAKDSRYSIALAEMRQCGYALSPSLHSSLSHRRSLPPQGPTAAGSDNGQG